VLSDPRRILEEAKRLGGQGIDTARLEALAQDLKKVEMQQRKLVDVYLKGSMPESVLEEKSKELSEQHIRLEDERRAIHAPGPQQLDLDQLAATLPEAAARLRRWVLEASEGDMELILGALQVKVTASQEEVQIEGSVPALVPKEEDLVTIVQTSA